MATSPVSRAIERLRLTLGQNDEAILPDAQLLGRFIEQRDEAAFAAVARRHGPMVMGVCLRVACNRQDAEDAFQATFLVLVRKAARIAPRALLANWLYGVAYNTALKARAATARLRAREKQVTQMPEPAVAKPGPWTDLLPLVDQELSRLPDKYRIPIILCDLEGKTHKSAARQLGCPEGSLSSRLSRARSMLAKRLARHGLAVSGVSLAAVLAENAAASVPPKVGIGHDQGRGSGRGGANGQRSGLGSGRRSDGRSAESYVIDQAEDRSGDNSGDNSGMLRCWCPGARCTGRRANHILDGSERQTANANGRYHGL